jgi:hypothetical protein
MDQRGAGVGAVENAVARVFDQDSCEAKGETLRLAVAEDDDRRRGSCRDRYRARRLLGARQATARAQQKANAKPKTEERRSHDQAPGAAQPTLSAHGAYPAATTQPAVEY